MKRIHTMPIGFVILTGFAGCSSYRTTAVIPQPRPLGKEIRAVQPAIPSGVEKTDSLLPAEPSGELTLHQAITLALMKNPELAAFSYEVRSREARALQASLLPNLEFGAELENFGGSGDVRGFDGTEITLQLSQLIELAGKRSKRSRVATLESELAAWDYESKRLDVFTAVRQAFLKVVAAQQRVTLNEELVKLSEQLLKTISDRAKAGKISPAEESRARIILSSTLLELKRARRELEATRYRLSATWGSRFPEFSRVVGNIDNLLAIPGQEKLQNLLTQNPDLARFETELKKRQAVITLEEARRIPDPMLNGGVRRLNETNDKAFVVGLSIPLPLSNRNQGARQEARYQLAKTLKEKQAVEVQLNTALSQTYNSLQSAFMEASTLKDQILSDAQSAYHVINDGYLMGRFDFLDVLDAQRTLFEARGQYLRSLTDFHTAVTEIERLIAQEINTVQ